MTSPLVFLAGVAGAGTSSAWLPARAIARVRVLAPVLEYPFEHFVHVHGIPWELGADEAVAALSPMLPMCNIVEAMLPLDKRARTTGRVLLRLELEGRTTASDVVEALQNRTVGTRWLEARLSTASEYAFQTRQAAAITARASGRIWKAFQADVRPAQLERSQLPGDRRDIVVLCHGTSARLGEGQINLNDLPNGRLDVMARCVAAALFVSYGIRRSVRLWLLLREIGLTICVDGALVKGLYPDERRLAVAIQQTLRSGQGGQFEPPPGWALHGSMASREDEAIGNRLGAILGATYRRGAGATGATGARRGDGNAGGSEAISGDDRVLLVVLDEQGAPFVQLVTDAGNEHAGMLSAGQPKQPEQPEQQPVADSDRSEGVSGLRTGRFRTVLVVGDHVGFTQEEQDAMQHLGAIKARLGPVQLLASHCIVLAHAVLDAANVARAARS